MTKSITATTEVQSNSNKKGERTMRHGIAAAIAMATICVLALAGPSARAALIAHYTFDGDSGTSVTDVTGNDNNGTATGTYNFSSDTPSSLSGSTQSMRF